MTVPYHLGRKLAGWATKAREAVTIRDDLIREAVDAGGSLREVGDLAGMSHTAIAAIAKKAPH